MKNVIRKFGTFSSINNESIDSQHKTNEDILQRIAIGMEDHWDKCAVTLSKIASRTIETDRTTDINEYKEKGKPLENPTMFTNLVQSCSNYKKMNVQMGK